MSEDNTNNHTQPLDTEELNKQLTRKTSSVPLRKETVRVTLKATPAGAKPTPVPAPAVPTAPKAPMPTAMTPSTAPHVAKAPAPPVNPDIPDVTSAIPLKHETMRVTLKASPEVNAPAPAAPVAAAPAPAAPKLSPAPTVALNVSRPVTGGPTLATQSLPQATVQLTQTQPMGTPAANISSPTIQTIVDDESIAEAAATREMILACAAFLLSLFVLFAQYQRASIWIEEHEGGEVGAIFSAIE